MKQAYVKHYEEYGFAWIPVEPTGICKKVTGGPYGEQGDRHYIQIQRRLFGIPFMKSWISEDDIRWFDPIVETVYECECGKNNA